VLENLQDKLVNVERFAILVVRKGNSAGSVSK
jgi:hypothetical protein